MRKQCCVDICSYISLFQIVCLSFIVPGDKKCSSSLVYYFLSLQGLAASVYYAAEEIEVLEGQSRPGRPRKGVIKDITISPKVRQRHIQGLKRELKENSGQMTAMLNSLFRPGRPVGCFCGECQVSPINKPRVSSENLSSEIIEIPVQTQSRVWPRTMVWINEGSPSGLVEPQPGPSSRPDPLAIGEPAPKLWRPFDDSIQEPRPGPSRENSLINSEEHNPGPVWCLKPNAEENEESVPITLCVCGECSP
ncbi:uncharacterized protein LOC127289511 [Leptopilina boulardi]|uniref:uncharacterized protein LOC127289511 n=1 Tax=Leptopilina boulardi TaxID=63433 RepID=UPI0021F652CF|nr:uncharacterized protein LOC127289511 [Leptopilina boulardi]